MRSTVAALCLLFVSGFLANEVHPDRVGAVRAAALATIGPEGRKAERGSRPLSADVSRLSCTAPPAPAKVPRPLRVAPGALPMPRAPDPAS